MNDSPNWRENYPLKNRFDDFLNKAHEWFILIRQDFRFRNTSFSEATKDLEVLTVASPYWGMPFKSDLLKVPGRFVANFSPWEGTAFDMPGVMENTIDVLHLPSHAYPSPLDYILQVEWTSKMTEVHRPGTLPVKLRNVFEITQVEHPVQTQITWAKCSTKTVEENLDRFSTALPLMTSFTVVEI